MRCAIICARPVAPIWEAVNAASLTPARAIHVDDCKGSLEPGKDADIAILNDEFEVLSTIIGGKTVYTGIICTLHFQKEAFPHGG